MRPRIWLVLAFVLLIVIGVCYFPTGIASFISLIKGATSRSNFPGALLAIPAWILLLPFSVVAIWRRRLGTRICLIAGLAGAVGTLTMPCAWERINRFSLLFGTFSSLTAALLAFWIGRPSRIGSQ
jgi:hypothetical protein